MSTRSSKVSVGKAGCEGGCVACERVFILVVEQLDWARYREKTAHVQFGPEKFKSIMIALVELNELK